MDFDPTAGGAIPRSRLAVGVAPALRQRLTALARGRMLVIDRYASRCCQSPYAVGDLTTRWLDGPVVEPLVRSAPVDRVSLAVDRRLVELLVEAGPTLRMGGPVLARHPVVELDRPELWLDFLATPTALHRHD